MILGTQSGYAGLDCFNLLGENGFHSGVFFDGICSGQEGITETLHFALGGGEGLFQGGQLCGAGIGAMDDVEGKIGSGLCVFAETGQQYLVEDVYPDMLRSFTTAADIVIAFEVMWPGEDQGATAGGAAENAGA